MNHKCGESLEAFTRHEKIRRKLDFRRVYAKGKKSVSSSFLLYVYTQGNGLVQPRRIGIIVRKKIGNAPVRNRCKRLIREIFRKHKELLPPGIDIVVVVRTSMPGKRYAVLENEWMAIFSPKGASSSPQQERRDSVSR